MESKTGHEYIEGYLIDAEGQLWTRDRVKAIQFRTGVRVEPDVIINIEFTEHEGYYLIDQVLVGKELVTIPPLKQLGIIGHGGRAVLLGLTNDGDLINVNIGGGYQMSDKIMTMYPIKYDGFAHNLIIVLLKNGDVQIINIGDDNALQSTNTLVSNIKIMSPIINYEDRLDVDPGYHNDESLLLIDDNGKYYACDNNGVIAIDENGWYPDVEDIININNATILYQGTQRLGIVRITRMLIMNGQVPNWYYRLMDYQCPDNAIDATPFRNSLNVLALDRDNQLWIAHTDSVTPLSDYNYVATLFNSNRLITVLDNNGGYIGHTANCQDDTGNIYEIDDDFKIIGTRIPRYFYQQRNWGSTVRPVRRYSPPTA